MSYSPGPAKTDPPSTLPEPGVSPSAVVYSVGTLRYTFLGLCIVFCWLLLGDFAISMRDRSMGDTVQSVLQNYHASNFLMTLMTTSLPTAIGLIFVPIISFSSDRHRGRWGRRIPYLLIPAPIVTLAMFGLAICPRLGQMLSSMTGMKPNSAGLLFFSIFWVLYEFAVIIAAAVFYGLINDVVPRNLLGRFFGLFRAVSLIAGMIFSHWLLNIVNTHTFGIFVGLGILFGGGVTLMCIMVKEGNYPPPTHDPDDPRTRGLINNIRIYFEECYCHPYYLWVFLAFCFAGLTFSPFNSFSLYYCDDLHMSRQYYGDLRGASYFVSLLLAWPLGWLVDKFHSLRVSMVTIALYTTSVLYGMLFVHDVKTFAVAFVAHTILSGTYFTTSAPLGQLLYPKAKYGQYSSAGGIIGGIIGLAWSPCMGEIIDLSGNNYHLTFLMGFIFCCISLVLLLVVYVRFMRLGGPRGYIAPDPDDEDPLHEDPREAASML